MSHIDYLDAPSMMKGERTPWSPTAQLVVAFLIGILLLSPAILGLYWELLLP
jgi:hypothetical protein